MLWLNRERSMPGHRGSLWMQLLITFSLLLSSCMGPKAPNTKTDATVGTSNDSDKPPLYLAIDANDRARIEDLLIQGVDIEQTWTSDAGRTYRPLAYAARTGPNADPKRIEAIAMLLEAGVDTTVRAPLVEAESAEVITLLLDNGADPDQTCQACPTSLRGTVPLILRAVSGQAAAVSAIADGNANMEIGSGKQGTALHLVLGSPYRSRHLDEQTTMDTMTALIDGGINVDATDKWRRSALFNAVTSSPPQNYVQPVLLLLRVGADPALKDKSGLNPLMVAARNDDARKAPQDLFKAYFSGGGDIALLDYDLAGRNALYYATQHSTEAFPLTEDDIQLVKLFLLRGAVIDHQDNDGYTVLMHVVQYSCVDPRALSPRPKPYCTRARPCPTREIYVAMIDALLSAGADTSLRGLDRQTAHSLSNPAGKYCNDIRGRLRNRT